MTQFVPKARYVPPHLRVKNGAAPVPVSPPPQVESIFRARGSVRWESMERLYPSVGDLVNGVDGGSWDIAGIACFREVENERRLLLVQVRFYTLALTT
jgi:hypothetical protein